MIDSVVVVEGVVMGGGGGGQQRLGPMWLQDKEAPNGLSSLLSTSEAQIVDVKKKRKVIFYASSNTLVLAQLSKTFGFYGVWREIAEQTLQQRTSV